MAGSVAFGPVVDRARARVRRADRPSRPRSRRTRGSHPGSPAPCWRLPTWCEPRVTPAVEAGRGRARSDGRRRFARTPARTWWPLGLCLVVALGFVSGLGRALPPPRLRRGPDPVPGGDRRRPRRTLRNPIGLAVRLQRGVVFWWAAGLLAHGGCLRVPRLQHRGLRVGQPGGGGHHRQERRSHPERLVPRHDPPVLCPRRRRRRAADRPPPPQRGDRLPRRGHPGHPDAAVAVGRQPRVRGPRGECPRPGGGRCSASVPPRRWPSAMRTRCRAPSWPPSPTSRRSGLLVGIVLALFGLSPRWVGLAWGVWAFWMVLAMFGSLLDPPALVLDLSPFEHTPLVPAQAVTFLPLVAILLVAAALGGDRVPRDPAPRHRLRPIGPPTMGPLALLDPGALRGMLLAWMPLRCSHLMRRCRSASPSSSAMAPRSVSTPCAATMPTPCSGSTTSSHPRRPTCGSSRCTPS